MYQFLSAEKRQVLIDEIRATRPTPEQIIAEAEVEHFRSVIKSAIGLNDFPDEFIAPDTTSAAQEHAALDELENELWQ